MSTNVRKSVNWIIVCLVIITLAAGMAKLIETDWGKVSVSNIFITDENGNNIAARLYRPVTVNATNKAPAVINIHGYQNDKLVDDSFAIELSRRGFVVVSPDVIGHGDSDSKFDLAGLLGGKSTGGMQKSIPLREILTLCRCRQYRGNGPFIGRYPDSNPWNDQP